MLTAEVGSHRLMMTSDPASDDAAASVTRRRYQILPGGPAFGAPAGALSDERGRTVDLCAANEAPTMRLARE